MFFKVPPWLLVLFDDHKTKPRGFVSLWKDGPNYDDFFSPAYPIAMSEKSDCQKNGTPKQNAPIERILGRGLVLRPGRTSRAGGCLAGSGGFPGDQGLFSAITVTIDSTGQVYTFRESTGRPENKFQL